MWWVMVSLTVLVMGASPFYVMAIPCEEARMKCAYRVGCGMALQNYVVGCSGVLQGPPPSHCPEICHHSLIALTSTAEGKALMNCECSDQYCEDEKRRSEICRPQVMKSISEPVVSCRVAQWICAADALCSTALEYYNHYCRAMFHGKKCTPRCINSISILRRQEQATKLTVCKCDGLEEYDCLGIQRNMEKLCFHKRVHHHPGTNSTSKHPSTPPSRTAPEQPPPDKETDVLVEKVGDGGGAAILSISSLVTYFAVATAVVAISSFHT